MLHPIPHSPMNLFKIPAFQNIVSMIGIILLLKSLRLIDAYQSHPQFSNGLIAVSVLVASLLFIFNKKITGILIKSEEK
jgi:hypothetical protein